MINLKAFHVGVKEMPMPALPSVKEASSSASDWQSAGPLFYATQSARAAIEYVKHLIKSFEPSFVFTNP